MHHTPAVASLLRRLICLSVCLISRLCLAHTSPISTPHNTVSPADQVYLHGVIYTANAHDSLAHALAIKDGRLVYVGNDAGAQAYVGPTTKTTDLHGQFVMPGLIDGHMHPLEAGNGLLKCSLHYDALTVPEMQQRIQACLDTAPARDAGSWLEVVSWFQESMLPVGITTSRATLDALHTTRPILVRSSFGHTALANTRALALAKIDATTTDPLGGKIWRDEYGNPTGLLEDAAFEIFSTLIPQPTAQENIDAARAALIAMNRQGVTSFLDADTTADGLAAFSAVQKAGALTARAHFAPHIDPTEANTPDAAIARVLGYKATFDQPSSPTPGLTVCNAKMYIDGVIAAPALTGTVVEPYRVNRGTADHPEWVAGTSTGPAPYFSDTALATLLTLLAQAGIDPHMHADGDGAVRAALNGIAAMRSRVPHADIRPSIAHDELVSPADFHRYHLLNAIPVLSFQWEKPAGDTVGLADYLGPERMKLLEPAGFLKQAGARVAFGSDWPVDALNEWFALKVAVTRTNDPAAGAAYQGRLGDDPGLTITQALRTITIDAAYELHMDTVTGSLEKNKYADFIVLDRNPFKNPAADLARVTVRTVILAGVMLTL